MGDFRMPSLGADMDAGTLMEWRVSVGDRVERGDIVAQVETEKGLIDVEIWESGVVAELLVEPGSKVPVGTVLANVTDGEGATARVDGDPSPVAAVRASPAARKLARELGVDLATLRGTGPHGAITREDVTGAPARRDAPAAEVAPPLPREAPPRETPPRETPPREAPSPLAGMRQAIAAAMTRSKREIPHYYLGTELDVSRAARWLEEENARRPVTERLLFAALLLKATALALRDVPELNGTFTDGTFQPSSAVHIGVAIALRGGGLVAPALHDADQKTLGELMTALRDLVTRVRAGSVKSSELTDPTITVTNLGDQGTDSVLGVIYPPQVAIVGFGTVRERPWAEGGMVGARPTLRASLAADHRVSDGHRGARLLKTLGRIMNRPEEL